MCDVAFVVRGRARARGRERTAVATLQKDTHSTCVVFSVPGARSQSHRYGVVDMEGFRIQNGIQAVSLTESRTSGVPPRERFHELWFVAWVAGFSSRERQGLKPILPGGGPLNPNPGNLDANSPKLKPDPGRSRNAPSDSVDDLFDSK